MGDQNSVHVEQFPIHQYMQSVPTCWVEEFVYDVNDTVCCHDVRFFGLQLIHQKRLIYLSKEGGDVKEKLSGSHLITISTL